MLLRCLQASSSFEEEWTALSGRHLRTGLRQGKQPGQTGRRSVKWTFRIMENSVCTIWLDQFVTQLPFCTCTFCLSKVLE